MNLVDDIDLVPALCRAVGDLLTNLSDIVHAVV